MTVKEIADKENVSIHTVRQWIRTGKLKAKCNSQGYDISEIQYNVFLEKVASGAIQRKNKKI